MFRESSDEEKEIRLNRCFAAAGIGVFDATRGSKIKAHGRLFF